MGVAADLDGLSQALEGFSDISFSYARIIVYKGLEDFIPLSAGPGPPLSSRHLKIPPGPQPGCLLLIF